mmetsp:Transcript_38063/g.38416  ORF Transcript_38063/g.38416 Transcript_38063/m.38416 type:complete len:362 (-) Transcript_38063:476-1561(-)|eukprot:CAMPEP_0171312848 /NCGR_PEP_ID=MMETSP0816-20121228/32951_1 /TAXON_ID=420281 /ORGANISM="Proboscia inermis, Strain CCAP1064/1" /LENGTH=361 /DNA_ID=CAMNT_0011799133 /DNA_START=17 /DNA_END=1102 /DNA_ORIENTATION=-
MSQDNTGKLKSIIALLCLISAGLLVSTIVVATSKRNSENDVAETFLMIPTIKPPSGGDNVCMGMKPTESDYDDFDCMVDDTVKALEQAGANVTKGYNGDLETDAVPILVPYYQKGLCPVNVHWHLGAEHYSQGEFDDNGSGPSDIHERRRLAGKERKGFLCNKYDKDDAKFTKEYDWKHCSGMEVGQTYEVHWPHSTIGACGTLDQYQTPFYDGVFCFKSLMTPETKTEENVGVQAQIFTIVNDEARYYPDLMRGMIVSEFNAFGQDIAYYTGSTTGTKRDNDKCSAYSPITWQVDRKCHLISASTFDKMCADMKAQKDDMSDDLHAHGSRELVLDKYAANNHVRTSKTTEATEAAPEDNV